MRDNATERTLIDVRFDHAIIPAHDATDERNFIDLARSPIWIAQEHIVVG